MSLRVASLTSSRGPHVCRGTWLGGSPSLYVEGPNILLLITTPVHTNQLHAMRTLIFSWNAYPQLLEVGGKGDLGDGSPSAGSRDRAPVGVWGRCPQKLKQYANLKGRKPSYICTFYAFWCAYTILIRPGLRPHPHPLQISHQVCTILKIGSEEHWGGGSCVPLAHHGDATGCDICQDSIVFPWIHRYLGITGPGSGPG